MSSKFKMLYEKGLIKELPRFIPNNVHYEVITGSVSYAVSTNSSDMDIVGFCIPPKEDVFPHLRGEIQGFGRQKQRFENWQKHHIQYDNKEYDLNIYSIVRFFSLCMEMNPNMVDCLFVPDNCVIHSTNIGQMVREKRHIFLSKACWPKFKGYAYSQMKKLRSKSPEGKRKETIEKFGYDTKYAYNIVRLLDEVQQILSLHDLNLQRDKERLKAIRNGEWRIEEIEKFFNDQEIVLEKVYNESKLPWGPKEEDIKKLLLECLESHYGSLDKAITIEGKEKEALLKIREICNGFFKY